MFTTTEGRPRVRQNVSETLRAACSRAGIDPAGVGTHTGRRSTVTNLYAAGASIDDVAAHVGHSSTETTRGYVQHLGDRPAEVARRAWALLGGEDSASSVHSWRGSTAKNERQASSS